MQEIKFKIITPMFLGDAKGETIEIRPPSIKGMLRFWWRAIIASDKINLKEKEAEIFGSSDEKIGRSTFRIIVKSQIIKYRYWPLPHHSNDKNGKGFKKEAIKPETEFSIFTDGDEKIQNLFYISSILGGLGNRSRRGFGSFQELNFETNFQTVGVVFERIKNLLDMINSNFRLNSKITLATDPNLEYPYIKEIEIGECYDSFDHLLTTIGKASHDIASMYKNEDSLGFAKGQNRLASPIYVSVIKLIDGYYPIITTLNTSFKDNNQKINVTQQQDFKASIL